MTRDIYTRPSAFYKMQTFEAVHPQMGPAVLRAGILSPRYGLANLGVAIEEVLMPVVRKIQPFGDHYNDYSVSSGVLSSKVINGEKRLVITTGNNIKLTEGVDPWKCCSEETSTGAAELFEVDKIHAIGVAAMSKVDDATGIWTPWLPPCEGCRTRMYENDLIDTETAIELVNTTGARETLTLQDMKTRYDYTRDLSRTAA